MQLTFYSNHDAAYLRFQEPTSGVETIRISDSVNVDLAPNGTLYGISPLSGHERSQDIWRG